MGHRIILCDGAELARLWSRIGADETEELVWVPREEESRARPTGFRALAGGITADALLKLSPAADDEFAIVTEDGPFARAAVAGVRDAVPGAAILVLSDRLAAADLPAHPCLRLAGMRSLLRDDVDDEFGHLANLRRVVAVTDLLAPKQRVGILLQPDPDPDGLACGYALRALLGRNRVSAPLLSFGEITRPENRAMVEALGIDVRTVHPSELAELDSLALVDVQPAVFGEGMPERLRKVDLVIDHHPERPGWEATIKDIRTAFGATATILTEYVRAAGLDVRPKLATALLYGIKTDTQLLGRETSRRDMNAFAFLHAAHSPALLRRIERPALPIDSLQALGRALVRTRVEEGIHLVVLGRVREDVIPQVAELALQAESAEWAIAAGVVGSDLVFSVRNVGYVRAAGDVVRAVVEGLGVGGGHRTMAKGIIPLRAFRKTYGDARRERIRAALHDAFVRAIRREEVRPEENGKKEETP